MQVNLAAMLAICLASDRHSQISRWKASPYQADEVIAKPPALESLLVINRYLCALFRKLGFGVHHDFESGKSDIPLLL